MFCSRDIANLFGVIFVIANALAFPLGSPFFGLQFGSRKTEIDYFGDGNEHSLIVCSENKSVCTKRLMGMVSYSVHLWKLSFNVSDTCKNFLRFIDQIKYHNVTSSIYCLVCHVSIDDAKKRNDFEQTQFKVN